MRGGLLILLLIELNVTNLSRAAEPSGLWPRYRHDNGLTGFSPLKGGLAQAPKVLWALDLGGRSVHSEEARLEDINGDGEDELIRILPDRLICQDIRGRKLWETDGLNEPVVREIRDFAGDGTRGLWSVNLGRTVGSPILADLYGDGKAEVIVPTEDGKLHCLGLPKGR